MAHVFISYSRKDSEYVGRLAAALEKEGLSVWLDERIDYGTKWPRVIEEKVDTCGAFVLVMSQFSKESDWVQKELARALHKKKEIFPVLLDGDQWLEVQTLQHADVRDGRLPPPDFYGRLSRVVGPTSAGREDAAKETPRSALEFVNARFFYAGDAEVIFDSEIAVFLDGNLFGQGSQSRGFDLSTRARAGLHEFKVTFTPLHAGTRARQAKSQPVPSLRSLGLRAKRPRDTLTVYDDEPVNIFLPQSSACLVELVPGEVAYSFLVKIREEPGKGP
jgi:hypothetical protein